MAVEEFNDEGEFIFKWCFYYPRRCSISYSPLKSYAIQDIEIIVKQGNKILNFSIQHWKKKIKTLPPWFSTRYLFWSFLHFCSHHCKFTLYFNSLTYTFQILFFLHAIWRLILSRLLKLSDSKVKCSLILKSFLHNPIFLSSHKKIERIPYAEK